MDAITHSLLEGVRHRLNTLPIGSNEARAVVSAINGDLTELTTHLQTLQTDLPAVIEPQPETTTTTSSETVVVHSDLGAASHEGGRRPKRRKR